MPLTGSQRHSTLTIDVVTPVLSTYTCGRIA
jgi:hypothetical protein